MAIYHCHVRPIQRSRGQSAVAAAAYRSGSKLRCARTGRRHDYRGRTDVDHTELVGWRCGREALWATAETSERRGDATTAREYEIALPIELGRVAAVRLVRRFARWLRARHDVAVDLCIHGLESANPHAHVMTTTRASDGRQLGEKVAREWSFARRKREGLSRRRSELLHTRMIWANMVNHELARAKVVARVDHRSYAKLYAGAADSPIPTIHLGAATVRKEQGGVRTDRGDLNRTIDEIRELGEQITRVREEIRAEVANDEKECIDTGIVHEDLEAGRPDTSDDTVTPDQYLSPDPDRGFDEGLEDWDDDLQDALDAHDPSEYEGPESYHENWGEDHEDLDHQDGDDWPDLE